MMKDNLSVFELLTKNNPAFTVYSAPAFTDVTLKRSDIAPPPNSACKRIEEVWKEEKTSTPHIKEGNVIGVGYMKPRADYVELGVGPVAFKTFLTSKFDRVPRCKVYGLGSGAITKVRFKGDDYVLFGRRGKKTGFTGGSIETIPQGLADVDDIGKRSSSRTNVKREYYEEAVGLPEIGEIRYMGVVQNPWGNNISPTYLINVDCPNSFDLFKHSNKGSLNLKTSNKDEIKLRELVSISSIEDYIREKREDIDWNSRARLKTALEQRII